MGNSCVTLISQPVFFQMVLVKLASEIKHYDWNNGTLDQKGSDPDVMATLLRRVVKLYCPQWQLIFQRGQWCLNTSVLLFVILVEQPEWILQADNQDSLPPLIQLEPQGRKHFRHVSTILNPTICRDNWNVGPSPLERIGNRRCDRTNLVFWTIVILDNNSDWRKSASRQLWRTVVDTTSDAISLRERDMGV